MHPKADQGNDRVKRAGENGMSKEETIYTEKEVSILLSQVVGLGWELETMLGAARHATEEGNTMKMVACMDRATTLMGRISTLAAYERVRTRRPRPGIREGETGCSGRSGTP